MYRTLRPGGRAVASTWAALESCPFFDLPSRVAQRYLDQPLLDPSSPGAFALGSLEFLAQIFTAAGFVNIETASLEAIFDAESAEGYWRFVKDNSMGALALAALPESTREAIHHDLVQCLSEMFPGGRVALGGEVLFVTGTK
jgi:hypothetical protein